MIALGTDKLVILVETKARLSCEDETRCKEEVFTKAKEIPINSEIYSLASNKTK